MVMVGPEGGVRDHLAMFVITTGAGETARWSWARARPDFLEVVLVAEVLAVQQ